jgi:hypothetical protein
MKQRILDLLMVLSFLMLLGIYVGAWIGWQKVQAYQDQLNSSGGALGLLASLFAKK